MGKNRENEPVEELDEIDQLLYRVMPLYEKRLRRKNRHKRYQKIATAAAAAVVLCFAGTFGMGSVTAMAAPLLTSFTVKTSPADLNMTRYTYSAITDSSMELGVKKPGYIPEGYRLVEEHESAVSAIYIYKDVDGRELSCIQKMVADGGVMDIDDEYDGEEEIETAYGTVLVHRYTNGFAFCYLEYMDCTFVVHAVHLNNMEIENIFKKWIL